jgi:hypothetical protein
LQCSLIWSRKGIWGGHDLTCIITGEIYYHIFNGQDIAGYLNSIPPLLSNDIQ